MSLTGTSKQFTQQSLPSCFVQRWSARAYQSTPTHLPMSSMPPSHVLAPLRSQTVRLGKRFAMWLSPCAADAKLRCWRLDRHGKRRMPSPIEWDIMSSVTRLTWRSTISEKPFFKSDLWQPAPIRKPDGMWFVNSLLYIQMIDKRSQHQNRPSSCARTFSASSCANFAVSLVRSQFACQQRF